MYSHVNTIFCQIIYMTTLNSFLKRFYLFEREKKRERMHCGEARHRGREREREKQSPCSAGSLMWGSIPGPWDHDLNRRQMLNPLSHVDTPTTLNSLKNDLPPWFQGDIYTKRQGTLMIKDVLQPEARVRIPSPPVTRGVAVSQWVILTLPCFLICKMGTLVPCK